MASNESTCDELDNQLHYYAGHCRGGFDFSLLFEEAILAILPICLLLLPTSARLLFLRRKTSKVVGSSLLPLKLVCDKIHNPNPKLTWEPVGSVLWPWSRATSPSDIVDNALCFTN